MVSLLKHQEPRPFAERFPMAAQLPHRPEAADDNGMNLVHPAGQDDVGPVLLDKAAGHEKRRFRGAEALHMGGVRPLQAMLYRGIARRGIGDRVWKEHRHKAVCPLGEIAAEKLLRIGEPPEAAAQDDADPGPVHCSRVYPRVLKRHAGCHHRKKARPVELPRLQGGNEVSRPKAIGLPPEMPRLADYLLGDRGEAADALLKRFPQ